MLRIAPFPADNEHVLPIEIEGKVDSQDFSHIVSELEKRADRHDSLRLYVEIRSLGGGAPKALFDDLKSAVKHWQRFDKIAVISDEENVRKTADFSDKVTSETEIRAAAFAERDSLQQWIIG